MRNTGQVLVSITFAMRFRRLFQGQKDIQKAAEETTFEKAALDKARP